ncbi:hypothetical protein FA041_07545 [Escherichia coli]|nr:hypothetical protein [Escherichia coli]
MQHCGWPDAAPAKLIKLLPVTCGAERYTKYRQPGNRLLWVEQVTVPDYLAGNGVVYQTSDVKYVIANNNLWASPLINSCATPRCQPEHATARLGGCLPASGKRRDTLNVTVTEFNGRYDGKVIVSGEWLLNHRGQLIKRPFRLEGCKLRMVTMKWLKCWPVSGVRKPLLLRKR